MAERTAVVVDEHPLWIDAVDAVVRRIQIDVVAKTTTPAEALEAVRTHRPNLLIADVGVRDATLDGLTLVRRTRDESPATKVIALSGHDEKEYIDAALDAGAVAYVVKTAHADDLAAAIRQTFEHSIFFAGSRPPSPLPDAAPRDGNHHGPLTRRELEILRLVAEGHSNSQLARMLWVTEQTVKFHLSNIYRKLDVSNRTEASRWAQMNGLLEHGAAT